MISNEIRAKLVAETENILGASIVNVEVPRQGLGSAVLIARDERGREVAIKYGADVLCDVRALALIRENGVDIPVPAVLGSFALADKTAMVMEKSEYMLLEDIPNDKKCEYIGSMLKNLSKLHCIKSDVAGFLLAPHSEKSWKDILLFKYSGEHPWFDWHEIMSREGVDSGLIQEAIERVRGKIEQADLPVENYSLLHTDFNQRNLFVDSNTHQIAGIIDWSEAMFGDPLYDFARVRMFIFHFNMKEETEKKYFRYLNLTEEERRREDIYLESQILDYIAWYSERKNNFNNGRLKLHQDFLRHRVLGGLNVSF